MTSKVAEFAPILVLVAFTLQGCIMSDFRPAVMIAIGKGCDEKVTTIHEAAQVKDVHAPKACSELDQGDLTKFKVTDCAQVLHDVSHFVLGATCEVKVAVELSEKKSCKPFKGAACKTDMDAAVQGFDPSELDDSEIGQFEQMMKSDGFEAVLGLVKACAKVVTPVVSSDKVKAIGTKMCADTDANAMSTMGVDSSHCMEYLGQQATEIGTVACVASVMTRDDAPKTPEDVTIAFIEKAAKEFGDKLAADFEGTTMAAMGSMPARLRLFQVLKQGKWFGKLRRGPTASVMAAWVATAFASAALLGVAWRRCSARQAASQDAELTLDQELQLAE